MRRCGNASRAKRINHGVVRHRGLVLNAPKRLSLGDETRLEFNTFAVHRDRCSRFFDDMGLDRSDVVLPSIDAR